MMHTLDDLENAKQDLNNVNQKISNYSGGNPNKYESDRKLAASKFRQITRELKERGVLEKTDQEIIEDKLDSLFPNAQSNSIHELNSKKYKRKYTPMEKSRSRKTVTEWKGYWIELNNDHTS